MATPPSSPVLDDWKDLRDRLRKIREPIRDQLPRQTCVGVAYPWSMSPIVRQYLPIVFGSVPATSQGRLPAGSRFVGLDAHLEALAREEIPPQSRYAVATGQGRTREWTAISIERGSSSNAAIQHPILWLRLGRTSPSLAALSLDSATPRFVAGAYDETLGSSRFGRPPRPIGNGDRFGPVRPLA